MADEILAIQPDLVIHTGDFFHRASPTNRALTEGLLQIKRFTSLGIPLVIIAGNHSTPRTSLASPILKALRALDHVCPVFEERYARFELGDTAIHCLPHINDESQALAEIDRIEPIADLPNLLLLHQSVGPEYLMESYGERVFPRERAEALFPRFEYVGLGHWHRYQSVKPYPNAYYAGSTERCSDRETGYEKGFLLVEIEGQGRTRVEFRPIATRPWHRVDVGDCCDKDYDSIFREVETAVDGLPLDGSLVHLYLHGLTEAQAVELTAASFQDLFKPCLHLQLVRRLRPAEGTRLAAAEISAESLEDLFGRYLKESADESEFQRLNRLARDYFARVGGDGQWS